MSNNDKRSPSVTPVVTTGTGHGSNRDQEPDAFNTSGDDSTILRGHQNPEHDPGQTQFPASPLYEQMDNGQRLTTDLSPNDTRHPFINGPANLDVDLGNTPSNAPAALSIENGAHHDLPGASFHIIDESALPSYDGTGSDIWNRSMNNNEDSLRDLLPDRLFGDESLQNVANLEVFDENINTSDDFGFGRFRIPDALSDAEDDFEAHNDFSGANADAFGAPENELFGGNDYALPTDSDDEIWNRSMNNDDDALRDLLADRVLDEERAQNVTNQPFFDENAAYDDLLEQLMPVDNASNDAPGSEPRRLTEDELRRHLPEHRDIYERTTYYNEAIHIALPYDAEFDCCCTDTGLPPHSEVRRKRAASEPLPSTPKRCCNRIPDPTFLTMHAKMAKTCYLEVRPFENARNETQGSSNDDKEDSGMNAVDMDVSMDNLTSSDSFQSLTSCATAILLLSDDDMEVDDSYNAIDEMASTQSNHTTLVTARSDSTTSVVSEADLHTTRAATPLPVPPPQQLPPVLPPAALIPPPAAAPQPINAILEADIENAIDAIEHRLLLIAGVGFRRTPKTLDLVLRLQRNRTTLKRLQKELEAFNAGSTRKTRSSIESGYDKTVSKLTVLFTEITRSA